MVLLSTWCFLRARSGGSCRTWALHGFIGALAFYSHFFALLVQGVHVVFAIFDRRDRIPWRGLSISAGITVALVVPHLLLAPLDTTQIDWIPAPNWEESWRMLRDQAGRRGLPAIDTAMAVIAATFLLRAAFAVERRTDRNSAGFLALWLALPLATVWGFSWGDCSLWLSRYFIVCVPAFAMAVAAEIGRIPNRRARLAVIAVVLAASAWNHSWILRPIEDWRGVASVLCAEFGRADVVVVDLPGPPRSLDFTLKEQMGVDGAARILRHAPGEVDTALLERTERLWLIVGGDDEWEPTRARVDAALLTRIDARFEFIELRKFHGVRLARYERR